MGPTLSSISIEAVSIVIPDFEFGSLSIEATSLAIDDASFDSISVEAVSLAMDDFELSSIGIEYGTSVNWIIYVIDSNGDPIQDVLIDVGGATYSTDVVGRADVPNIDGDVATLMVMSKVGYQTYKHNLVSTEDTIWYQTLNRIVPFVVANGETIVNPNPSDPDNNRFY